MEKLLSVSQIAKEAGVTVRTIQYYDNAGILKPHSKANNKRMYTSKELVILHQIKSLQQIGLSLNEIKEHIVSLDTPEKVLEIIKAQKQVVSDNIQNLKSTLTALEILEIATKNNNAIDFSAYADILSGIKEHAENVWSFNIMKPDLREHIFNKFAATNPEAGRDFYNNMMNLFDEVILARQNGITLGHPEGMSMAQRFADMIDEFTGGDPAILASLYEFGDNINNETGEFAQKWKQVESFFKGEEG